MENREELVKALAPVSLKVDNSIPSWEECINAISYPSFRSEDLSQETAIIHLYAYKDSLKKALDLSNELLINITKGLEGLLDLPEVHDYVKAVNEWKESI